MRSMRPGGGRSHGSIELRKRARARFTGYMCLGFLPRWPPNNVSIAFLRRHYFLSPEIIRVAATPILRCRDSTAGSDHTVILRCLNLTCRLSATSAGPSRPMSRPCLSLAAMWPVNVITLHRPNAIRYYGLPTCPRLISWQSRTELLAVEPHAFAL
jgi:hypothetical protein